jgi:hypothetical protein
LGTTTNDYDDLGNVVLSIDPAGKSKTATYNPAGQGVVGAGGFAVVDAGGTLHESGPIDRNNYVDESEGSRNVTRAAAALLLPNADYADIALKFDRWCVFDTHGGSGGGCRGGSIQTGVKDAARVAVGVRSVSG